MSKVMTSDNEDRVERAFHAHHADLLRYFARRISPASDAEDALIDVFAIACRREKSMPAEPEARLWLFGVARHVLANRMRRTKTREALRAPYDFDEPAESHDVVDSVVVRAAFRSLSDSDRELLGLYAWEGFKPAEIARILGVPAPVVSARLSRARRRFAHRLQVAGVRHGGSASEEQLVA